MSAKVLIAHAKGEDELAEKLAGPIRQAGYEVAHEGTILVGESVVAEASKLLAEGAPVVLCGTVRAMGTKWAKQVARAVRQNPGVRLFVVQMEEEADVETVSFDESVAQYWQDTAKAERDLVAALHRHYPPDADARQVLQQNDLEARYRDQVLKSCEISDHATLSEDDRHLVMRDMEWWRLYVALRMRVETPASEDANDGTLQALEVRRLTRWGKDAVAEPVAQQLASLGERLKEARRLVVLGDPGAGKSTLLRWLATALLLRMKNHPDWRDLPDITTLPDDEYLPILVRCRDLPEHAATLDDMLHHTLRKSEVTEAECAKLRDLLRVRLKEGKALLLIDGLDEITQPGLRTRFSEQIEQIHRTYPDAPIVVTSRIVGYREMGYRIRSGFEHLTVADLTPADKDDFAKRWCAVTERTERRDTAAADLIRDIHSSDRIERLTGNPMLLTTMALVKRKVGKLPQRRVELYEKAVEVLLNWRSAVDDALDKREALPQLEYLAYEMCRRGVQQLREDEVLELLRQVRLEYPQIHPLTQHTPEEFLALLERRTGMMIQSGHQRYNGQSYPVYEFRHLTFQEYLAGIALVQGHFPGRVRERSLAQNVAPLAGVVGEVRFSDFLGPETTVVENWREALRLCVAACNDDDVDAVLEAILEPLPDEQDTTRARAVLAALCLADEPNVSDSVAGNALEKFSSQVTNGDEGDGGGSIQSSLDMAALDLAASRWREKLQVVLLNRFFMLASDERVNTGGVYSEVASSGCPATESEFSTWLDHHAKALESNNERQATGAALAVMVAAYRGHKFHRPDIHQSLICLLDGSAPAAHAAAWALGWISEHCKPSATEISQLMILSRKQGLDRRALSWLIGIFGQAKAREAVGVLLEHLQDQAEDIRIETAEVLGEIGDAEALDALFRRVSDRQEEGEVRRVAAKAMGKIGGDKAVRLLQSLLGDNDAGIRRAALAGLAETCQDETDKRLLTGFLSSDPIDPQSPITEIHVVRHARPSLPSDEVRRRYEALASRFGLKLAWKPAES